MVNNHRAKVLLSGITDSATLEHARVLIGESEQPVSSTTVDRRAAMTTTTTSTYRRLAPADALRRVSPGRGVLVSGHLPPALITLRPSYGDAELPPPFRGFVTHSVEVLHAIAVGVSVIFSVLAVGSNGIRD